MRNGRLGLGLGFGGVVWLAVLVGCGASTNSAAKTTTAAKVATPAPALVYQLPEDPLAAVPAGVLLAGRMRVEDFDKAAELASLRQMLQDFLSRPDTPELARFVRAHAKEIGIGFGFDAGGEIRLSLVASGDFSGWQNTAQGAELRDLGHGARALVMKQAAASDKEPSILVLDGHHIAMLDPTLVDATLATLSDPKRSALSQSGLAAMVQSSGFHQASAALALDTSSPQIRERAASDPRLAGFMELLDRVTGLEAELFLDANGVRIVGQLHTRSADAAAIFAKILKLGFAQQQGALSKLDITARD
ncbi:MAG TPA: hypothetical protein VHM19_12730, partial [Polyangiales bacterium]|nr:hypothetical protein [Polyangiales bacterium]